MHRGPAISLAATECWAIAQLHRRALSALVHLLGGLGSDFPVPIALVRILPHFSRKGLRLAGNFFRAQ